MKKLVLYPILFSVNPLLLLYVVNVSNLAFYQLSPLIFIAPLVALLLLLAINRLVKDGHRAGFIVFILALWFFYYVPVRIWVSNIHIGQLAIGSNWVILPAWSIIFLFIGSTWLWKRITHPETITLYLNLVCIVLVSFSLVRITLNLIPMYFIKPAVRQENQLPPQVINKADMPDIYYIILDGYARQDVLNDLYNYDNSTLVAALRDRGFYIASQSQSNYIQTALSLDSSLNMQYLSGHDGTRPNQGLIMGDIYRSKSRALFEQLGYKYVAFSTGYPPVDLTTADIYIKYAQIKRAYDLEALLMLNSTLAPFIDLNWIRVPITRFSTPQKRIDSIFNSLKDDVPQIDGPKFVFGYIFAPHPPSVFDRNGPITPDATFIMEGAFTYQGTIQQYVNSYIPELIYINQRLIETIDGILTNSKTPPVIIIQADHGPDAYLDWKSLGNTCLKERFSILNAYYFPGQTSNHLSEDINPVNTFAVLFNTYFGTNFKLQENHQYFATWENQFPFDEVTDISQTCNRK